MKKNLGLIFLACLMMLVMTVILRASTSDLMPSGKSKPSYYDYDESDKPPVWFFPKEGARWDGNKITSHEWFQLAGQQKDMFITEGIAELERTRNVVVESVNKWRLRASLDSSVSAMSDRFPNMRASMLKTLFDALKDSGWVKSRSAQADHPLPKENP
ncbi:MAG: hypothetical protein WCG78_02185 [Candidatus Omnitrophota bacterium]